MILICGATGNIGGEAVRRLVEGGHPVRALSRDPSKAALPRSVQVVRGDLSQPASLGEALAGVKRALLVAGAQELPGIARSFAAAAKRAGVEHLVLNSSGTIEMDAPTVIGGWHQEAEQAVKESGLAWTFLRPGNFASNTLQWAGTIRTQNAVFGPGGDAPTVPIDPRDIGRVAAAALSQEGHQGKTYLLTGPEVMTTRQQVEQLGVAIGRPLRFVEVPEAGARAGMLKSGMPELMADAILELMRAGREPREERVTDTVQKIAGTAPRTFAQWAKDHASSFLESLSS